MTGKTTQQKRLGTSRLNRLQVGVVMGCVAIGLLLTFGAGFIVGMWYRTSEHITPIVTPESPVRAVESQAGGQDLTFYSTLTPELPAKPAGPVSTVPPQAIPSPREVPTTPPPVPLPAPKAPERSVSQEGSLPQPKTSTDSPRSALSPASETGYSVQVGSFRAREEAERLHHRLTQKGYAVSVQPSIVAGRGIWYRVRVGYFSDRPAADRIAQRLATQERVSVMVTEAAEAR